jgi:hypothetical protein
MRAALSNEIGSAAQIVSSVVNAVQIQFFKYWYVSLADALTEWENPRTDTEFEDAMIPKLYLFEVRFNEPTHHLLPSATHHVTLTHSPLLSIVCELLCIILLCGVHCSFAS